MPSTEKSPVSERDAPIVIGAWLVLGLELEPELVLAAGGVLVLLLVQAATRPTERTAAALRARRFLESQGSWGLTPGASFLFVRMHHG